MQHRYDPATIEPRWQAYWKAHRSFRAIEDPSKPKYYVLCMFPYPSGAGLHVGHPESYTAVDIVARYRRQRGYAVLNPIGFDAFGLPAERAAVREGRHPREIIEENIVTFTRQLERLGFSFDWDRCVDTSDPEYYRWTQWIFRKMVERGLAYLAKVPVYWCPAQKTVLANEEVQDGVYVETGDPVERRTMRQWMLRITSYAERLLEDLESLDWPENVKEMQRNWIGRSEGAMVTFAVADAPGLSFEVFTTRPDTLYGATWCVLAPEHPLVEAVTTPERAAEVSDYVARARQRSDMERVVAAEKEKTGVFTGAFAVNPANGERIPIWVADYVLVTYGTGAIMAVPAHDERDHAFARTFGLPIVEVVSGGRDVQAEAWTGDGVAVNSPLIDGLAVEAAKARITAWLEERGLGRAKVQYKLRDWLFSRQRYWGEPFPVVFEPDGSIRLLPEDALPVPIPELDDFRPTEDCQPPLARATDWIEVDWDGHRCLRESNTMPQWAGSCWYYLRYMDPHNDRLPVDAAKEAYWGPVDLYIGGVEHAVTHLLYARFWHKVLYDVGLVHTKEPFQRLFNQGMILAFSYRDAAGKYYHPDEVEQRGDVFVVRKTGAPVEAQIEKMSKSKRNVVDPLEIVDRYGADALRMYEMFMGPLEQVKPWQTSGVQGVHRFLQRLWRLVVDEETGGLKPAVGDHPIPRDLGRALHLTIRETTEGIETIRLNTPISRMMEFVNLATGRDRVPREALRAFLAVLSPYAPHIAEELWERLGLPGRAADGPWPAWDPAMLVEDLVEVAVQVQGRLRATLQAPRDLPRPELVERAKAHPNVVRHLEGKVVVREIVVPNRLVNLVVRPG
ncbi:MAG: leucine--tRNA ligase [Deltaproteobacteria bacterium]|nr:leucine--tRNA ligase [Deltaproteobacteria bacterium]